MASGATRSGRTYCFQEYVENLERYRAGGYHPTYIDDELSGGRYRIVQKLGFGSYSTVWLAKDGKNDKYVAIKIGVSENAQLSREVSVLKYLSRAGLESKSLGRDQIPRLLDHFLVGGPNGQHQCLVFEPSRCSLSESKYESRTGLFPLDAARAIATQLILGVAYLHSFGVVHGDLHLGNILFRMDGLSIEGLYQRYGEPLRELVKCMDNAAVTREAPTYTVIPVWLGIDCEDVSLEDALIHISDFGEAFRPDRESRTVARVPILLRPPEQNFFNQPLGFPADIWTLACTLYEVLGERSLFEGFLADVDDVLAENISTIGNLPEEWSAAWSKRGDFFTLEGDWKQDTQRAHEPRYRPVSERVDCMGRNGDGGFSCAERADLIDMLERMLVFEPAKRITAEELTRSAWMKNWGLPALAKVDKSYLLTNQNGATTYHASADARVCERTSGSNSLQDHLMPFKDQNNNKKQQRELVPLTVNQGAFADQLSASGEARRAGLQSS